MPKAQWYRITTRRSLEKGETGFTTMNTRSLKASHAMGWILGDLPDGSYTMSYDEKTEVSVITIDWTKVPDYIRDPDIPARSR